MRGWVYVIKHPEMPAVVKVGFSMKDPKLRAQAFKGTGMPFSHIVEYDVLVNRPRDLERRVHNRLGRFRADKEWFRCSVEWAVQAIRDSAGNAILLETFRAGEVPSPNPPSQERDATICPNIATPPRTTGTYAGTCSFCGSPFSVTLARHDFGAQCPVCRRTTDTSDFKRQELRI
jgi:hypothetical protein